MVSYEVIESIVRHVVNNLDPKASFGRPRTYDICKVWYRIQRMLRRQPTMFHDGGTRFIAQD